MHVVRHDDIASNNPPRTVVRQSPFLRKNPGYTLFCQDLLTIFRADRHEINRRLNPNPITIGEDAWASTKIVGAGIKTKRIKTAASGSGYNFP
jgi:hypothetical protein